MMLILLTLIISFAGLLWAANHLVTSAHGIASYYRLSPLLIGLTLVAFGTSAPEIIIAISASLENLNDLAIGTAIGSNIANIGLVLGLTAIFQPLRISSSLFRREYPLVFIVMLFTYSLMIDGYLGILDSCLFLLACILVISYLIYITQKQSPQKKMIDKFQQASLKKHSIKIHYLNLMISFVVLLFSAKYLISSCSQLADYFGAHTFVVGLTIVAFGSCLPELAAAIVAVKKGADDLAVGIILGSNIFNLLAVMIFPGIIHPAAISHAVLWRDIPAMFVATAILLWINYSNKKTITRWHGGLLILMYCCYILSIFISASN